LLFDTEQEYPEPIILGKIVGIDLGLTDFAITNDGEKNSKYPNPRHINKHERKLARKKQGSLKPHLQRSKVG
jgi:putative transposase